MKKLTLIVLLFVLSTTVIRANSNRMDNRNKNKSAVDTLKQKQEVFKEKQRFSPLMQVVSLGSLSPFTLKTTIDEKGITYCYSPLNLRNHTILWKDIDSAYVRTYRPVMEYGGWGIKYSFRNGKVYNVMGKKGLQLVLKNGRHILFGTQKPEEVKRLIDEMASAGMVKEKQTPSAN